MGVILATVGSVTGALLVLGAALAVAVKYLKAGPVAPSSHQEGLGERVAELEVAVRGLPSLWEEERNRAKKHADSAKQANREAARKLEEVAQLVEAELALPGGNAPGGDQLEMQPLSTRLGDPTSPDRAERVAAVAHLLR